MKLIFLSFIFAFSLIFPVNTAYADTPTLRVVLAIDTWAHGGAGEACKKIGASLDAVLEQVARKNNIPYDRTNIEAFRINENYIHQFYAHHPVGTSDTLLFYYCGHGLMHPPEHHVFTATGGRVERAYIRKIFSFLPAKLKIIATETCSSYSVDSHNRRQAERSLDVISDLLFNAKGTVDITAASPGQTAWFGDDDEGGMFTNALMDVFQREKNVIDTNQDGRVSWMEAFPFIQAQANLNFQALKKASPILNEIQLAKSQDPYFWKLTD